MLDNNGFVIISEKTEHTGQFFGQIDGTIMDSLVQDRIYKKITVYDYQGACSNSKNHYSGDAYQVQPFDPIKIFFNYLVKFLFVVFAKINAAYGTAIAYAQDDGKCQQIYKTPLIYNF